MDGRGIKDLHKCGEEMSKNSSLPSREQQETSELNGSGGGRGKGIRGARPFVPVGGTNRDKRGDFCPGWWFQPGQKATRAFCPPTGTKGSHFVPVGVSNRDKRPPSPPLARLAVGPGTKATYCPGPKGCRDKWPGTKACFVVVRGIVKAEVTF